MRVTNTQQVNNILYNLEQRNEAIGFYQNQLSTGKAINQPSDDPVGTDKALGFRHRLAMNEQYQRNIDDGMQYLGITDNTMDTIGNLLEDARAAAVQGDNDNLQATDRAVLANQVNQLLEQLLNAANTQYNGKYIFAGYNYDSAAFTAERDGSGDIISVSANPDGIDGEIKREIGISVWEPINIGGGDLFQSEGEGAEKDMFNILINLRNALNANEQENIGPQIDALDEAIEQNTYLRAVLGERVNYMNLRQQQLETQEVTLTEGLEGVEDVDYTEAVMNYELEKNAYTAALATGAQIMQMSLLDYL